jgi:hypothetical protein
MPEEMNQNPRLHKILGSSQGIKINREKRKTQKERDMYVHCSPSLYISPPLNPPDVVKKKERGLGIENIEHAF